MRYLNGLGDAVNSNDLACCCTKHGVRFHGVAYFHLGIDGIMLADSDNARFMWIAASTSCFLGNRKYAMRGQMFFLIAGEEHFTLDKGRCTAGQKRSGIALPVPGSDRRAKGICGQVHAACEAAKVDGDRQGSVSVAKRLGKVCFC